MSSTNKTDRGFNQWVLSDKPTMLDYNVDNQLADELIGALEEKLEGVDNVAQALAGKADVPVNGLISPAWLDVPLANGATTVGTDQFLFCKMGGIVYLRGLVTLNTLSGLMFGQLPEGYRPNGVIPLIMSAAAHTTNAAINQVIRNGYIGEDGSLFAYLSSSPFSANVRLFIYTSFIAEQ